MGWLQEHEALSLCGSGLLLKASSSVLFSLGPGNSAYSVLWIAAILQTNAYCYPISLFRYLIGISNIIYSKENATVIYIIKITCFQSTCSTSTGFFVLFFFSLLVSILLKFLCPEALSRSFILLHWRNATAAAGSYYMISQSTPKNLSLLGLNTGVSKLQIKGQIGLPPIFV